MKKIFSILIISLIIMSFFLSCNNKRTEKQNINAIINKIKINVNNETDSHTFDDFFEYSHHIVLQTTDSSLISKIDKIQIVSSKIYILDKTDAVIVFDSNGNFIRRIYHKGQSGMEYINATDFEVDAAGNIYICDFLGGKILKYNYKDEFIETISLPVKVSSFKIIGDSGFALNLRNGSTSSREKTFCNYLYYKDNHVIYKEIPFNSHFQGYTFSYGYGLSSFYSYNDKVFMTSLMNDTIFTIDVNGGLSPFIVYDFNIKKPELSFSKAEIEQYIQQQQQGDKVSSIYYFYLFGNYSFISFDYRNQANYIISKNSESPLFVGKFGFDKNGLCILPVAYLSDADKPQLMTFIDPDYLPVLQKRIPTTNNSDLLLKMQKSVVEGDNPILVFYDWKYQE